MTENFNQYEEKIIHSTSPFQGKVFSVEVADVELVDQTTSKRELVHHRGGACVVAIDEKKNIYLVEQYRIATKRMLLELPAGKLEIGEEHFTCAQRELTEELGIKAENWSFLSSFYPTPGYCDEEIKIYLAEDLTFGEKQLDPGEFLNVVKIPLEKAIEMIKNNEIIDAKTMIGILLTAGKVLEA